jgi:hypothetical protein
VRTAAKAGASEAAMGKDGSFAFLLKLHFVEMEKTNLKNLTLITADLL